MDETDKKTDRFLLEFLHAAGDGHSYDDCYRIANEKSGAIITRIK